MTFFLGLSCREPAKKARSFDRAKKRARDLFAFTQSGGKAQPLFEKTFSVITSTNLEKKCRIFFPSSFAATCILIFAICVCCKLSLMSSSAKKASRVQICNSVLFYGVRPPPLKLIN